MIKVHIIQYSGKFQGNSVFQGKRELLKNPAWYNIFQYSENFQGNSVFQGKRKLLKHPQWSKMHIQYSEFRAPSVSQGKCKLLKTPECEKHIQYSENFQGYSVFFRASASCSRILNGKRYIPYGYKFQGTPYFSGQAQVAQKSWM